MHNSFEPVPTVGRIVLYQTDERGGLRYVLPAIISGTQDSHAGNYPDGTPNPLPVPDTGYAGEVHLTVFTPGPGGVYAELSVPYDGSPQPKPRTWRWPSRT